VKQSELCERSETQGRRLTASVLSRRERSEGAQ
jgi:hypothetical protein